MWPGSVCMPSQGWQGALCGLAWLGKGPAWGCAGASPAGLTVGALQAVRGRTGWGAWLFPAPSCMWPSGFVLSRPSLALPSCFGCAGASLAAQCPGFQCFQQNPKNPSTFLSRGPPRRSSKLQENIWGCSPHPWQPGWPVSLLQKGTCMPQQVA